MSPDDFAASVRRSSRALRAHLTAVHERAPGFTEGCASACLNADGINSYAWLCHAARPPESGAVLDLACGSGVLLERCRSMFGPDVALSGLDMSAAELALAESRLGRDGPRLHRGLAQKLDFASDNSFDAVLCHWALTLMDPLEPVLEEIRRVLRPGGTFAAIVDGPASSAPGYSEICALIDAHVRRAAPDYAELGDPRARDGRSLAALARSVFPGADVRVDGEVFSMQGHPARLAETTAGFFYSTFVLGGADHEAMLDELTGFFAAQARPRYNMPVNRLCVAADRS